MIPLFRISAVISWICFLRFFPLRHFDRWACCLVLSCPTLPSFLSSSWTSRGLAVDKAKEGRKQNNVRVCVCVLVCVGVYASACVGVRVRVLICLCACVDVPVCGCVWGKERRGQIVRCNHNRRWRFFLFFSVQKGITAFSLLLPNSLLALSASSFYLPTHTWTHTDTHSLMDTTRQQQKKCRPGVVLFLHLRRWQLQSLFSMKTMMMTMMMMMYTFYT